MGRWTLLILLLAFIGIVTLAVPGLFSTNYGGNIGASTTINSASTSLPPTTGGEESTTSSNRTSPPTSQPTTTFPPDTTRPEPDLLLQRPVLVLGVLASLLAVAGGVLGLNALLRALRARARRRDGPTPAARDAAGDAGGGAAEPPERPHPVQPHPVQPHPGPTEPATPAPGHDPGRRFTEIYPVGVTLRTTGAAEEPPGPDRDRLAASADELAGLIDQDLFERGDLLAYRRLIDLLAGPPDQPPGAAKTGPESPPAEAGQGAEAAGSAAASSVGDLLLRALFPETSALPPGITELWLRAEGSMLGMLPWELTTATAATAEGQATRVQRWRSPLSLERELALAARGYLQRGAQGVLHQPAAGEGWDAIDPLDDPEFDLTLDAFEQAHGLHGGPRLGPATFKALRLRRQSAGARAGLGPLVPRLVVIGDAIPDVITRAGKLLTWRPFVVAPGRLSETLDGLEAALVTTVMPVVYVGGSFVRAYGTVSVRMPSADRAGRATKGATKGGTPASEVSVTELDRAFAQVPSGFERPLLVLDAESPRSPVEAAMQLLLRNAFAHDLFALGNVSAIVALGVEAGPKPQGCLHFFQALADGASVPGAIRAARGGQAAAPATSGGLPPEVSAGAIALWSNLPGYALPRIEVEGGRATAPSPARQPGRGGR